MTVPNVPIGVADLPLSAQIYETLRERIIRGSLPAGTRIRENDLAAEFRVSRIPVREALPRLEHEGFVTVVPRRGAVVTELTLRDVEELFTVRSSLEPLTARLAAQASADGASTEPLLRRLRTAEEAVVQGGDHDVAAGHCALHEEILALSGNGLLISMVRLVNARLRRLARPDAQRDLQVLSAEHRDLCMTIAAGNVELSGSLAEAHVEGDRVDVWKAMQGGQHSRP